MVFDDGGWDWPLWKWKGPIVTEGRCVYGKFFAGKAGFVSKDCWPDPSPNGEGNFERRGRTPQESFDRMFEHLRRLLPEATDKQITKLIK